MMQDDLMKQWSEFIQASANSFKELTEANNATLNSMMQGAWNMNQMADLTKASMAATQQFNETNVAAFNSLLKNQLKTINLNAYAMVLRELSQLSNDTMSRLMQHHFQMMQAYVENSAAHLEKLSQAENAQDLTQIQMHLFSEMQAQMKDNALQTINILESIKSALVAWSEKSVEQMSSAQK